MKYKLIAMDFDGTLLNDKKEITNKTKKCLELYRQKGCLIVGVTARNLSSVKGVSDIKLFDYLILNNGSCIYDTVDDKLDQSFFVNSEDANHVTQDFKDISKRIEYCCLNHYYVFLDKNNTNLYFIKDINNLSEITEKIMKINITLKDQSKVEQMRDLINSKFSNLDCYIMQDKQDKWLFLMPTKINKATTIEQLGDKLNIKLEEMIFFGDSLNDLEIIEKVGMGVAMGNALELVKKKAKAITKTNNEDGIYYFLNSNEKLFG